MLQLVSDMLIDLIGIDTRCGIAPELPAAQYLQAKLSKSGIACSIYEPKPGRANLVAVIRGKESSSIILHAHLDTANFYMQEWHFLPLQAIIEHGRIYGRGALDCKGLCAIWTGILLFFAEHGLTPQKTIIFAATADEEAGGFWGVKWLCENTLLFNQAILAIGEGGGFVIQANDDEYFTIQTGERSKIAITGELYIKEPSCQEVFTLGMERGFYNEVTQYYIKAENYGRRRIDSNSFYKTIIEQEGDRRSAYVLPFLQLEESGQVIPNKISCKRDFLAEAIKQIQEVMCRLGYDGKLMPYISMGFSDNRFFRNMGIPTFGFFPIGQQNAISGIHGADEYIDESSLKMAFEILLEAVLNFSINR